MQILRNIGTGVESAFPEIHRLHLIIITRIFFIVAVNINIISLFLIPIYIYIHQVCLSIKPLFKY